MRKNCREGFLRHSARVDWGVRRYIILISSGYVRIRDIYVIRQLPCRAPHELADKCEVNHPKTCMSARGRASRVPCACDVRLLTGGWQLGDCNWPCISTLPRGVAAVGQLVKVVLNRWLAATGPSMSHFLPWNSPAAGQKSFCQAFPV